MGGADARAFAGRIHRESSSACRLKKNFDRGSHFQPFRSKDFSDAVAGSKPARIQSAIVPGAYISRIDLKDPIVTVQKDGEAAVRLSPKRFAKQYAVTYKGSFQSNYFAANVHAQVEGNSQENPTAYSSGMNYDAMFTVELSVELLSETYKKTKVSACGRAAGGADD